MKTISYIVIGSMLGLLLAGGVWVAARPPQGNSVVLRSPPTPELIHVNVVGAVERPGLYELNENSRVADAVEAAGGFVAEANMKGLNLAARLENEEELNIPFTVGSVLDEEQYSIVVTGSTPSVLVGNEQTDNGSSDSAETDNLADIALEVDVTDTVANTCSNAAVGSGAFVWPADNHFLSGKDYDFRHLGIDIAAGEGAPVYAADSGVVTEIGNDESGYGNVIEIDHGNGYVTIYGHFSVIEVKMCQSVYAGQRIGAAGNTGDSTGGNLHFEVLQDDWSIDPWSVLPE